MTCPMKISIRMEVFKILVYIIYGKSYGNHMSQGVFWIKLDRNPADLSGGWRDEKSAGCLMIIL